MIMTTIRKVLLTAMLLMFISSAGYASDWKYMFTAPTGGEWFYIPQSITRGEDTVLVRTKWKLSMQEAAELIKKSPKDFKKKVAMTVSGAKVIRTSDDYIDINHFILKEEINCSTNAVRIMSMVLYDYKGAVVWYADYPEPNKFEDVFPDGKGAALIGAICKECAGGR